MDATLERQASWDQAVCLTNVSDREERVVVTAEEGDTVQHLFFLAAKMVGVPAGYYSAKWANEEEQTPFKVRVNSPSNEVLEYTYHGDAKQPQVWNLP